MAYAPTVDTSGNFRLGGRHYPTQARGICMRWYPEVISRNEANMSISLIIFEHTTQGICAGDLSSHLKKGQVIDASTLLKLRTDHLDGDDVFAPEFPREIILVGVQYRGSLTSRAIPKELFEDWQTLTD